MPEELANIFRASFFSLPESEQVEYDLLVLAFWLRWAKHDYRHILLHISQAARDILLRPKDGEPASLSPLLHALYVLNPELAPRGIETEEGRLALWGWLFVALANQELAPSLSVGDLPECLFDVKITEESFPLSLLMRALLALHGQSQASETTAGRRGALGSLLRGNFGPHARQIIPSHLREWLEQPIAGDSCMPRLSRQAYCLAFCGDSPVLHDALDDPQNRLRLTGWELSLAGQGNLTLSPWAVTQSNQPSPFLAQAGEAGFTLGMHAFHAFHHAGVSEKADNAALRKLAHDAATSGCMPVGCLPRWSLRQLGIPVLSARHAPQSAPLDGINLLGWVDGILGIGEDARTASHAMTSAGIPHVLLDVTDDLHHASERIRPHLDAPFVEAPHYFVNTVYLAAHDLYKYHLNSPRKFWENHYTIASCPWEIPDLPLELHFVFNAMDEIWAPTQFIARAFDIGRVPVSVMPLVVDIKPTGHHLRKRLQIPGDAYVFLFTFDYNSSIYRKNPQAVIRAFSQAFSGKEQDVRLVLKSMNGGRFPDLKQEITDLCRNDPRILLFDEVLSRPQSISLMETCDCFISLHRAEGFGRNIAESMLLGKPVISSNYSGNCDFTLPHNSCLVSGKLTDIDSRAFLRAAKGQWFEADVDEAAAHMRHLARNREEGVRIGAEGRETILKNHSAAAVGAKYRSTLENMGLTLG
jgi:glycosyltransferase involved in cell wall biosynthesis